MEWLTSVLVVLPTTAKNYTPYLSYVNTLLHSNIVAPMATNQITMETEHGIQVTNIYSHVLFIVGNYGNIIVSIIKNTSLPYLIC